MPAKTAPATRRKQSKRTDIGCPKETCEHSLWSHRASGKAYAKNLPCPTCWECFAPTVERTHIKNDRGGL